MRVHCFLKLLKIKRWKRKKKWFLTFLTPPQKRHFLTEKRHFWPIGGQIWKKRGHIHMSILYMKILYDMGFWFATFFCSTLWPPITPFLTKKRHFWPPGTKNEKNYYWFICPFYIWRYFMIWNFEFLHFFYTPPRGDVPKKNLKFFLGSELDPKCDT